MLISEDSLINATCMHDEWIQIIFTDNFPSYWVGPRQIYASLAILGKLSLILHNWKKTKTWIDFSLFIMKSYLMLIVMWKSNH